jgi:hypothetical protein
METDPQPPIASAGPPGKPKRIAIDVIAVLVLVLIAIALMVSTVIRGTMATSAQATLVGNRFMGFLAAHNLKAAYGLMAPQMQGEVPFSSLQSLCGDIQKANGNMISHGQPEWTARDNNGQITVQLTYLETFSKCQRPIDVTLIQSPNGYQVYGFFCHF